MEQDDLIKKRDYIILEKLIQNGDYIELEKLINDDILYEYRNELILETSYFGHVKCLKLLLGIKSTNNNGDKILTKPLHYAAVNGNNECIELLLNNNEDVNILNDKRWSPLHFACYNGQYKSVELLLYKGANLYINEIDPIDICQNFKNNDWLKCIDIINSFKGGRSIKSAK